MKEQIEHMAHSVRPSAFFSLRTQFENVGDALINREMVRLATRHADVGVDLSRCPPDFRLTLALDKIPGGNELVSSSALFREIVRSRLAGRSTYYFLSPGGYVGDRKGVDYVKGCANTMVLRALHAIGVRICHIGVSYESLTPRHAEMIRTRSPLLHRHLVRDETSARYMTEQGVRVDGVMPDLAWGAVADVPGGTQNPRRTNVALSFRTDQFEQQLALLQQEIAAFDYALPIGIGFRFVVQVARDRPAMEALMQAARARGRRPAELVDCHASIPDALANYRDCTHVVANRLHALLVGAISGAIPVALVDSGSNRKIDGLFNSIKIEGNRQAMEFGAGERLASMIEGGRLSRVSGNDQLTQLENSFKMIFS